ncbi:MAG: FAD-dependent oxidoreductase, partial [Betaproteobacteria bacterium]|nr:FAD-dependent oxidoreductase [Betaproteobacteria bacterium]
MPKITEVTVPDIGDFQNIDVIDILVKPGDKVRKDDSLISLESEKATMEIPSPQEGVVKTVSLKVGDKVSQGALILTLEAEQESAPAAPQPAAAEPPAPIPTPSPASSETEIHADVVVLGAGPGGYTAAFRAADLGKKVVLIERYTSLGGVCLNVGCIPSKALLHVAKIISEADEASHHGVKFGKPKIDIDQIRSWKESVVAKLTGGLAALAKQRNVTVIRGVGRFIAPHHLRVASEQGEFTVTFDNAIIAAGSQAVKIPAFPEDPRIMDSTGALELSDVPKRMLVIGGGIIGLEMATVYQALGSRITVVELGTQLIPGADPDLVRPLHKRIEKRYEAILLKTRVAGLEARKDGILASFEGDSNPAPQLFDRVLVAVGRRPNGKLIGAEHAGIQVDDQGFIPVDKQQRTNVPHIFAI